MEIAQALGRFHNAAVDDHDLSRTIQVELRVSLIRRFLTDDLDFVDTAKNYIEVSDFYELSRRVICPPRSHGKLGGKSSGLFLAAQIVRKSPEYADALGRIRIPRTWYVTSDGVLNFIEFNQLEDVYNRKYLEIEQVRREYPHIVQVFKDSHFSPEIVKGLSLALDDFEGRPLIVRSSSLLEDRVGSAFSGKYKSLFLANQGTKSERLSALMDAIAEVYASIFGPDPDRVPRRARPPGRARGDGRDDPGSRRQPRRASTSSRRSPGSPSPTTSSAGRRGSSGRTAWSASCRASGRAPWTASATTTRC